MFQPFWSFVIQHDDTWPTDLPPVAAAGTADHRSKAQDAAEICGAFRGTDFLPATKMFWENWVLGGANQRQISKKKIELTRIFFDLGASENNALTPHF